MSQLVVILLAVWRITVVCSSDPFGEDLVIPEQASPAGWRPAVGQDALGQDLTKYSEYSSYMGHARDKSKSKTKLPIRSHPLRSPRLIGMPAGPFFRIWSQ